MYGQIVERQPTNWWGDPIPGDYIVQSEFLADLEKISRAKALIDADCSTGGVTEYSQLAAYKNTNNLVDVNQIVC